MVIMSVFARGSRGIGEFRNAKRDCREMKRHLQSIARLKDSYHE